MVTSDAFIQQSQDLNHVFGAKFQLIRLITERGIKQPILPALAKFAIRKKYLAALINTVLTHIFSTEGV